MFCNGTDLNRPLHASLCCMFTYTAGATQYTPKLRLSKFVKTEAEEGEIDAEADRGTCMPAHKRRASVFCDA